MVHIRCGDVCFENIQAVLFDKDGTLANSQAFLQHLGRERARLINAHVPGVLKPLRMAFGLYESHLNPAGLLAVGTRSENEIAAAAYIAETGRDWIEALKIVQVAFVEADKAFQRKAAYTPLFSEAFDLLQALSAQGVRVGIISSDTTPNVQDFVEYYQIQPFVQALSGSEPGLSKPDPALLWNLCDRLGVEVNRSLVIGDSTADVEMAIAAGAAGCIGVNWGWTTSIHLAKADALINSASEIALLDPIQLTE